MLDELTPERPEPPTDPYERLGTILVPGVVAIMAVMAWTTTALDDAPFIGLAGAGVPVIWRQYAGRRAWLLVALIGMIVAEELLMLRAYAPLSPEWRPYAWRLGAGWSATMGLVGSAWAVATMGSGGYWTRRVGR